ncbi:type II toxin-antitoxin system MqsA family antitoxin [Streptomyces sp. NPDC004589]|uniref:type II toxin-antitoxin system MqsA family antitoxin n=1 Tax=Streptomyces sp. NPDC004589 TaxID=3154553 RepID=UPI0033BBE981
MIPFALVRRKRESREFTRHANSFTPLCQGICKVPPCVKSRRGDMSALIHAVETLVTRPELLPPPETRARLRKADGLTQQEVASVFGVTRVAFNRWEVGAAKPRQRHLEAYIHLLRGWAAKHPQAASGFEFAETR